jgi:DNA-directed RNA polymerase specialized sigma subunit
VTDTIPPEVLAAGAGLTPAVLPSLSDDELLGHLESVAGAISQVSDRQQSLWDLRLAIYQEARRRQPPITQQRIASAAGVSEVAVIQAIKKSAKKAEAAR